VFFTFIFAVSLHLLITHCRAFIPVLDHRCSGDSVAAAIGESVESLLAPCAVAFCVLKCSLFGELFQNCLGGTLPVCSQVYD